jgi:hypothetical protein
VTRTLLSGPVGPDVYLRWEGVCDYFIPKTVYGSFTLKQMMALRHILAFAIGVLKTPAASVATGTSLNRAVTPSLSKTAQHAHS